MPTASAVQVCDARDDAMFPAAGFQKPVAGKVIRQPRLNTRFLPVAHSLLKTGMKLGKTGCFKAMETAFFHKTVKNC
jgi:hypothetical protein